MKTNKVLRTMTNLVWFYPFLSTQKDEEAEDWQQNSIFHTPMHWKHRPQIIDPESCTNTISEDVVHKLGLKTKPHPNPYKLNWVNNSYLEVNKKSLVTYSIASLIRNVECDLQPMKVCHLYWVGHGFSTERCSNVDRITVRPFNMLASTWNFFHSRIYNDQLSLKGHSFCNAYLKGTVVLDPIRTCLSRVFSNVGEMMIQP